MILVAQDFKNSGTAVAWRLLQSGKSALEALEQGIRAVESNVDDASVGLGGYPNAAGIVELDAGVMDGWSRRSGAVGGLKGFAHPVSVAFAVMNKLPHVLLVGDGAARFADEIGAEHVKLLTAQMRERWLEWAKGYGITQLTPNTPLINAVNGGKDPWHSGGTTVYIAQDRDGNIAAVTSTSGWAWKYPGRLGDSPIAGAGFYADNRYGAAACTGMGELSIRTGLARTAVQYLKLGMSVNEAVETALKDILELARPPAGTITLNLIDAHGSYHVASIRVHQDPIYYYVALESDDLPVRKESAYISF